MALYEEFAPRPNRLINAHSAYLRSAAYQPIGWYEYGPEAFTEARRQDKPIFLDIGAIWCHWCHVIDRESYEDPDVATLLNEYFIPVKVDRDERPDIDARYQVAVQLLTGQGGWPLTVILTPDGKPFYGGTYFPPEDRYERVGLKNLLPKIADVYRNRRHELEEAARTVMERTMHANVSVVEPRPVSEEALQQLTQSVLRRFNTEEGGFERSAPKFPHASALDLALQQWDRTRDERWRTLIDTTLTAMGKGGIYDQLGGGFHRYSTDTTWTVPHFEKMSYDNALLLKSYVHAYRATNNIFYRDIAIGTLDFLLSIFTDEKRGGFYSSQDADHSMHDDGDYWTWSFEEFSESLTPDEMAVLARYYGVRRRGNMAETGRNVLQISEEPEAIARTLAIPLDEVQSRIARGKAKLLDVRRHRKMPRIDITKYANWNGFMISACLAAGTLLERQDALDAGLRTVDTLIRDAYEPDHGIYHAFHTDEGAIIPGFLEDQVTVGQALLDAFAVSGHRTYLDIARQLFDLVIAQYWDEKEGGFFDVAREREETSSIEFMRQSRKVIDDMPTPSPNALAILGLNRLALLTREDRYSEYARRTLEAFAVHAPDYGPFAAAYGAALSEYMHPPMIVSIIGPTGSEKTRALHTAALQAYRPGKMVALYSPDEEGLPYPSGGHGEALAYVCAGSRCAAPAASAEALQETLSTFGR